MHVDDIRNILDLDQILDSHSPGPEDRHNLISHLLQWASGRTVAMDTAISAAKPVTPPEPAPSLAEPEAKTRTKRTPKAPAPAPDPEPEPPKVEPPDPDEF